MFLGGENLFVGILRDISEQKAQTEALEYQTLHDVLTSLPNRTLLNDRLHQAILAGSRQRKSAALLIMDVDGFKEVNDTYGHHVGDQQLQRLPPIVAADVTPWLRHSAWGVADRIPPRRMQQGTRSIQGTPDLSGRQGRGKSLPDGADVPCKDRMIPFQALEEANNKVLDVLKGVVPRTSKKPSRTTQGGGSASHHQSRFAPSLLMEARNGQEKQRRKNDSSKRKGGTEARR
jgi:hypothetical protein